MRRTVRYEQFDRKVYRGEQEFNVESNTLSGSVEWHPCKRLNSVPMSQHEASQIAKELTEAHQRGWEDFSRSLLELRFPTDKLSGGSGNGNID